jgi:Rieske Fe-S protein
MRMWRRTFLGRILTLALAALGRRVARAQNPASPFRPLARPVIIPLEDLATPWRAKPFVADGVTLASAATPNQPIRVTGIVVRTVAGNDQPETFAAICVRCPHEGCDVEFLRDANQLPTEVKGEIGRPVTGSVYVCPCHNSTFAAGDGARLAGPAPRGLYRFKVTGVTAAAVEIAEVEEDVLIFV